MRIAVWWHLPPGGARRALRDHLRGLAERGHEIHAVRPPVPSPEIMAPDEFCASMREVPLPTFHGGGRGYVGNVLAEIRRSRRTVPAMEAHCAEAGRIIRELRPDVLFANTCWLMAAPSIVRHVGDLPRVTYLQEPKRSLYEAMPRLPWVQLGARSVPARVRQGITLRALARQARLERENAEAAGTLLVNSRFSRESVRRAYGVASTVAYLGVDTERFCPADVPRERFVLGVGALAPTKGVKEAIAACAEAGLPLVWVGPFEDDVYGPEAREQGAGMTDFRIGISDDELIGLYRRCLAVVATAPLEPFGYTPLEAGACGTPVVALASGGFRETIVDRENGFLADSVEDVAAALEHLAGVPTLAAQMGAAGRRGAVERWSLEAATTRIEDALVQAAYTRPRTI